MKDWLEIIGFGLLAVVGFVATVCAMVIAVVVPVMLYGGILGALGAGVWLAFKFITGLFT